MKLPGFITTKVLLWVAGISLAMNLAQGIAIYVQSAVVDKKAADLIVCEAARDTYKGNAEAAQKTADSNNEAIDRLNDRLSDLVEAKRAVEDSNRKAVEELSKKAEAATASAGEWRRRYQAASKSPDCRAVLEMELCPELQEH